MSLVVSKSTIRLGTEKVIRDHKAAALLSSLVIGFLVSYALGRFENIGLRSFDKAVYKKISAGAIAALSLIVIACVLHRLGKHTPEHIGRSLTKLRKELQIAKAESERTRMEIRKYLRNSISCGEYWTYFVCENKLAALKVVEIKNKIKIFEQYITAQIEAFRQEMHTYSLDVHSTTKPTTKAAASGLSKGAGEDLQSADGIRRKANNAPIIKRAHLDNPIDVKKSDFDLRDLQATDKRNLLRETAHTPLPSPYAVIQNALPRVPTALINMIGDYANDLVVYGPEAWNVWGVEVVEKPPQAPRVELSNQERILLYIPQSIRFRNGEEKEFTLTVLKEITENGFNYCENIEEQLGNSKAPGWVLMDTNVMLRNHEVNISNVMLEALEIADYKMPQVLEAVAVNMMVFKFTKKRLHGREPLLGQDTTFIRCVDKVNTFDGAYGPYSASVSVGNFDPNGDHCYYNGNYNITHLCIPWSASYGIVCVQREF